MTYTYDLGNEKTETFTLPLISCTLTEDMVKAIPQIYTDSELTPNVIFQYNVKETDYTIFYEKNSNGSYLSYNVDFSV